MVAALLVLGGCDGSTSDTSVSDAPDVSSAPDVAPAADVVVTPDTPTVDTTPPAPTDFEARGPHPVGNRTFTVSDAARQRELVVEVWYPAEEGARAASDAGEAVTEFAAAGADREAYAGLLKAAPEGCPTKQTRSARGAAPVAEGALPLVIFSHCHGCTRFSSLSIAEQLASHGVAVAAVDHADGTLFDDNAGDTLRPEFLRVRADDVHAVLAALLDAQAAAVPEALRGRFDVARLGVMGHSFGSVTAGLVLMEDARLKAGIGIAAPMENPLLEGVLIADIHAPLLLFVATEDNSITELGNGLLRDNFENANPPVWKLEVGDAGHWSFSDLCGLTEGFMPCCGEDKRQTKTSATFTYLPIADGLAIGRAYAAAFFGAHLLDDAAGAVYLAKGHPADVVTVEAR